MRWLSASSKRDRDMLCFHHDDLSNWGANCATEKKATWSHLSRRNCLDWCALDWCMCMWCFWHGDTDEWDWKRSHGSIFKVCRRRRVNEAIQEIRRENKERGRERDKILLRNFAQVKREGSVIVVPLLLLQNRSWSHVHEGINRPTCILTNTSCYRAMNGQMQSHGPTCRQLFALTDKSVLLRFIWLPHVECYNCSREPSKSWVLRIVLSEKAARKQRWRERANRAGERGWGELRAVGLIIKRWRVQLCCYK